MDYLVPSLIYLVVPALGFMAYLALAHRMRKEGEPNWIVFVYFSLFLCWGGVLLFLLTGFFWTWSGAASIGMVLLFLYGPILIATSIWLFRQRESSKWKARAFWASAAFGILWLMVLTMIRAGMNNWTMR